MPISSHLLERAYQLINANQMQSAELVLDAVVRVDPQNIEAWIAYMEIHRNCSDLEWLKGRLLRTREISEQDKFELLQYHAVLVEHLRALESGAVKPRANYNLDMKQPQERKAWHENMTFELLNIFNYSIVKREPIARPRPARRRFWKDINLATPAHQAVALLGVFIVAVRLLLSAHLFLGYGLLGAFLVGSFYCLRNYKFHIPLNFKAPPRTYALEDKTKLTEKKIVEVGKEAVKEAPKEAVKEVRPEAPKPPTQP
ncbi:MAG: hypothetical protein IT310_14550 [Anaerolineales bacterium]|nr:hypothetical protein [Anaerolineales bacterium]